MPNKPRTFHTTAGGWTFNWWTDENRTVVNVDGWPVGQTQSQPAPFAWQYGRVKGFKSLAAAATLWTPQAVLQAGAELKREQPATA